MVVVKHNDLIDAAQRLSVIEARILLTCISRINSKEVLDPTTKFSISAQEIAELVGIEPSDSYDKIKEAVARLYQREVIFLRPSKRVFESRVRWVFQIDYLPNEGIVELSFSPPIVQLLSGIKGNFTQYKLENVLGFKSQYSFRLYELVCRWGGKSKEISIVELRDLLFMEDKYLVWQDFKKRVLEPAVLEINALHNTSLAWEGIKRGRDVAKVRFTFGVEKHTSQKTKSNKKIVSTPPEGKVNNLDYYVGMRKKYGEKVPVPKEIETEMREKGLW